MPVHDLDSPPSDRSRSGKPEAPDDDLALEFLRVTELAALAAGRWTGRGDETGSSVAAKAAAHTLMGSVPIRGTVVMSEREDGWFVDGEHVGNGRGPTYDVAVDPLDGARLSARGMPNALAVIAATERGRMYRPSPVAYMDKLVVGPEAVDVVGIDRPVTENVRAVAAATRRPTSEVTVAILDRLRHLDIVREVRDAGARVLLIGGGDVAAALAVSQTRSGVDMLLGVGGAHEGVLAAAAVAGTGGSIQARLWPRDVDERRRAVESGLDVDAVLHTGDLVDEGNTFFCATGVTDGDVVHGVHHHAAGATTHSIAMHSGTGTVQLVEGRHRRGRLRDLLGVDLGP